MKWQLQLACAFLIISGFFLTTGLILAGDEGLYSIAIKDMHKMGLMPYPTYFGEPMFWKPPLMFWVYSVIAGPFLDISIPQEIALRIPSLILVVLSSYLLFKISKDELGERKAYIAVILFLVSAPVFSFGYRVLTDTLVLFLVLLGIYQVKEYLTGKRAINLIILAMCIFGMGLAKSHMISILFSIISLSYYFIKGKQVEVDPKIIATYVLPLIALFMYPMLTPYSAYYYQFFYGDSTRLAFNIPRIFLYLAYMFRYIAITGVLALIVSAIDIFKTRKVSPYDVWAWSSFVFLASAISFLPWYFIFFVPAYSIILARKLENNAIDHFVLAIVIIASLYIAIESLHRVSLISFDDEEELQKYTESLSDKDKKVLFISRLSECIINSVYDLNYRVVVTPENSFLNTNKTYNNKDDIEFLGVKKVAILQDNMDKLIHDYDDETLIPKFIDLFNAKERYIPPIGRTRKYWEGGFEVIIAEKDYGEVIKIVAPEYYLTHITKNGEFYVFESRESQNER